MIILKQETIYGQRVRLEELDNGNFKISSNGPLGVVGMVKEKIERANHEYHYLVHRIGEEVEGRELKYED